MPASASQDRGTRLGLSDPPLYVPVHVHRKLYLPHYLGFEEASLFAPGEAMRAFDTAHGRSAILICNDAWQPVVPFLAVHDGARMLFLPSNSSTVLPENEPYWCELTR